AGWGVYSFFARPNAVPFQNFTITPVTSSGDTTAAAISPDGKYILSVKSDAGEESLWLRNIPTGSDTQVIAPAETSYRNPAFSPDGNYIYFKRATSNITTSYDLFRAPVLGGTPQVVARDVDSNVTFSPDAKTMVYLRANDPEVGKFRILTAAPDGSNETTIYSGPLTESSVFSVSWSPGDLLAWPRPASGASFNAIALFDVSSKDLRGFAPFGGKVDQVAWMPDGNGLVIADETLQSGARTQLGFVSYPSGKFTPLTRDTNNYPSFSLSSDGKTIAAVQQVRDFHLALLSSAGAQIPAVALATAQDISSYSWDGNDLLLNKGSDIVRVSSDGQSSTTLIHDPGAIVFSVNSCPAAHAIVFTWLGHGANPNPTIWRAGADGTNPVQVTHGQLDLSPICSPDGKWLYYSALGQMTLMRVPLAKGSPAEAVAGSAVPNGIPGSPDFSLSPDGKELAFLATVVNPATKQTRQEIGLLDINAGKPARLLDPDPRIADGPIFTLDGKALSYKIREKGVDNIWIQPLDGKPGHQLTKFTSEQIQEFQWSPDGKSLAVLRGHINSNVVLLQATNP
ncbi:MAG: PD40 domain-containing protein, partial [Acidobacteriota bacterium]|nr:PD40 domain-containing protein [Acidobacteriota bacterium]